MFSFRFSGSKFLKNLRRQFCVRSFFSHDSNFAHKFLQDLLQMRNLCSRVLF